MGEHSQAAAIGHDMPLAMFQRIHARDGRRDSVHQTEAPEAPLYAAAARWARTIESKDAFSGGHCERVAYYASMLAYELGFDDPALSCFRLGAVLHDVGKVAVPSEILNKPGRLTREERDIVEQHPAVGAELLSGTGFSREILPMVRSHHERWDGTGYPDRLAGEDIPLSARVICVADVYDALTTDRSYRRAFTREQAIAIMKADRELAFDPTVFDRFERLIRRPVPCVTKRVVVAS